MKTNHKFLFKEGEWLGEGKVTFSTSSEDLPFQTKWIFSNNSNDTRSATQKVQAQGLDEGLNNHFVISKILDETFEITIKNENVDNVTGKGVYNDKSIGWEFQGPNDFKGYEVFELKENGEYSFHAEYTSTDGFRTIINGRVWEKTE